MTPGRDSSAAGSARRWRAGSREILLDHPIVVGILNVTPDSFSDGGNFFPAEFALRHVAEMIADGADIIDVGGESTRPGAVPVDEAEERRRVTPLVQTIRREWPQIPISVDTVKAGVASAAIDAGADIVNDVSALRLDPAMAPVIGKSGCGVVLMHSRGDVTDMATYEHASYRDVTGEVISELSSQLLLAEEAGTDRSSVVIDPGFGFSKRSEHSVAVLRDLARFSSLDVPVMVGVSRKRFVREAMSAPSTSSATRSRQADAKLPPLDDTDIATAAVNVMALERGAMIFRVHNVRASRRALDTAWTILAAAG